MQTNYTIDYKHEGMTLRQYIHPNGRLQLLNDSTLADHIGIDILLFSFEGLLILGRRSCNMVTVTGGKIGPFGAGALKAADLPLKFGQLSLTNLNLLRELYDESGLNEKDIIKENIYVLGITRDLLRGGKPQLSLCVRSKLIAEDIFKKHPTAETSYEHDNLIKIDLGIGLESIYKVSEDKLDEVGRKLGEKLSELGKEMTEPLLGALALWWRSVSRNKKAL